MLLPRIKSEYLITLDWILTVMGKPKFDAWRLALCPLWLHLCKLVKLHIAAQ
jgi:hypothetical protein